MPVIPDMEKSFTQQVHGTVMLTPIVSTEVSILIPVFAFEEACTAGKAAKTMPLHVMVHEPLERGFESRISLYRNDDVSDSGS